MRAGCRTRYYEARWRDDGPLTSRQVNTSYRWCVPLQCSRATTKNYQGRKEKGTFHKFSQTRLLNASIIKVWTLKTYIPIILGGVLPAFLWGITAVFQKLSATASLGPGRYLTAFGAIIALSGFAYVQLTNEAAWTAKGTTFAVAAGVSFSMGTGLLSFALWRYGLPISRVSPILSANVLVPVLIGVLLLGEGHDVDIARLIVGTALTLAGVALVTSA